MSVIERGEVVSDCERERREKALAWFRSRFTHAEASDLDWIGTLPIGTVDGAAIVGYLAGQRSCDEELAAKDAEIERWTRELD